MPGHVAQMSWAWFAPRAPFELSRATFAALHSVVGFSSGGDGGHCGGRDRCSGFGGEDGRQLKVPFARGGRDSFASSQILFRGTPSVITVVRFHSVPPQPRLGTNMNHQND